MGMKLAMIMGAVMITMGLAFSWYYKDTQERMGVLRENAAKLEVAVRANEEALAATQADAARNAALNLELQTKLQVSEKYGDELRATLQKHNLTALAQRKPGLIENRMQDATNSLWNDLRSITDPNGVQQPDAGTQNSNSN